MHKMIPMVLALMLVAAAASGQSTATPKRQVSDLIAGLHAPNWKDRASAYEQLRNDPTAIHRPEVKTALLDLLDREDHADWSKEAGFDPGSNEAHAEYLGELGDIFESLSNWNDPREVCILAHSSFSPDSKFATRLAMSGEAIIPCLMQMTVSTSTSDRNEAVPVLIQLRSKNPKLSSEIIQKINQATVAALHDPQVIVRLSTIAALRDFGAEDMIPALQDVAETDPEPEFQGSSVRKYAARGIAVMRKRLNK